MTRRSVLRGAIAAVAVIGVVVLVVIGWMVFQPGATAFAGGHPVDLADYHGVSPVGVPAELAQADIVTRGEYVTRMADCEACHTVKGGTPFAGGRAFKLPFGTLYTPNITPDRETGIGAWSDADFIRAVHKGVAKDGTKLYPAFPYASYTALTDQDVLAIKAYLFSLKAVHSPARPNTFGFPYNQRWLMGIWSLLFNGDTRFRPVTERTQEWNRGAYLVDAAGHCGECHTPRNLMQAMNTREKFAGGAAEGWTAYNITGDRLTGVGAWSPEELTAYLAKGHALGHGTASGPMAEVVNLSTSHLAPSDLAAIVTYLKTIPAIHTASLPDMLAGPAPVAPKAGITDSAPGKRTFEGACASCHAWNGAGALLAEAQLTGSRAINDPSAVNVAQMILSGTGTQKGGRPYMPGFAAAYSDREIADVANYVTARFGAKASRIDAKGVATLRAQN